MFCAIARIFGNRFGFDLLSNNMIDNNKSTGFINTNHIVFNTMILLYLFCTPCNNNDKCLSHFSLTSLQGFCTPRNAVTCRF